MQQRRHLPARLLRWSRPNNSNAVASSCVDDVEGVLEASRLIAMKRQGSIYVRLIIPLGLTLLIAMIAAWAIAVKLLTDTIDRRLDDQLDHATAMLAQGEFPFSPDLITRLDRLIEARIALLDSSGTVALATTSGPTGDALRALLSEIGDARDDPVTLFTAEAGGSTWRIALRPLTQGRDLRYTEVAAIASLDDSREAARDAAKLLGAAMLIVTVLLAWVGHYFTDLTRQSRLAGLGDLSSRIAHEIRNPLTAIKMQLQLLEEKSTPDDATRIGKLLNEIRRMEMIVESALTLGAPMTLQYSTFFVDEFIVDLADLLQPALAHRNIELRIAANVDSELEADADRLRQVLINLINNAADELDSEGVILVCAETRDDGRTITIKVEDSGSGFDERRNSVHSSKPFGLGIGLTICREIIEKHHGDLVVDRSPELGGARIDVRLPMTQFNQEQE